MKKQLLVVDDEPRLTGSFKVLFESKDFSVKTASNAFDAIKLFKKNPFKVAILDIRMDKMDGIELMHALKQIDPCVQIVFLTGYASVETATIALKQNNAFEYLEKPVTNMDSLCKIIERAIKRYDQLTYQIHQKIKKEEGMAIFRNIFDTMEAIVYVSDIQTHELMYANKKFKKTFGWDDTAVLEGLKCWQVTQKGQSGPCPFCTNKRLIMPNGKPAQPYEYEFRNTHNQRWYSIVDKAIEWYDKRIVRLETAFDITEKKEHEKLFREFEKAIETSKKLEIMGTLAGGVAHDFNNTLSTILGNINLAELSSTDNNTQHYLQNAEKGVMQAKRISSNLIAFAKGNKPLKTKIDIEQLIRQILEKNLDPEKICFFFKSDGRCDAIYADMDQLKVAIENMLQNAVESMGGAGKIDMALKYLEHPPTPPRIALSISDSGCGIPWEHIDMIFNPYFTSKPLDRRKSTGLGLSVAWSIITRHGGTIRVESIVKKGTTFQIVLPVFSGKKGEKKIDKTVKDTDEKGLNKMTARVLVMDDDELILDVISRLLMQLGYETLVACNGSQAVEICKTAIACDRKIDIVLLDFDIQNGMGGFPTMEKLKKKDPDIRGLLITGHADDLEVKNFKHYGFNGVLYKPFSITYLNDKIRGLLAQ